jgi:hypothetical protein
MSCQHVASASKTWKNMSIRGRFPDMQSEVGNENHAACIGLPTGSGGHVYDQIFVFLQVSLVWLKVIEPQILENVLLGANREALHTRRPVHLAP